MSRADSIDRDIDDERLEISWLEIVLVIAALSLTFQLWPAFYFKTADIIYDTLDFRQWTWRTYLVVNVLAFVALAVIRVRQNRQ